MALLDRADVRNNHRKNRDRYADRQLLHGISRETIRFDFFWEEEGYNTSRWDASQILRGDGSDLPPDDLHIKAHLSSGAC